jgi:hypothetical protein
MLKQYHLQFEQDEQTVLLDHLQDLTLTDFARDPKKIQAILLFK